MVFSEIDWASKELIQQAGIKFKTGPVPSAEHFPLVVFVHGFAGDAGSMSLFYNLLPNPKPFAIFPQAPLLAEIGGFTWWEVTGVGRENPQPRKTTRENILTAIDQLSSLVSTVCDKFSVDRGKISAIGFSQGAMVSGALALRSPKLFHSVALLSGLIPSVVFEEPDIISPSVPQGGLPSFLISHGSEDDVIPLSRAELTKQRLENLEACVEYVTDPVGHKLGPLGRSALRDMLKKAIG